MYLIYRHWNHFHAIVFIVNSAVFIDRDDTLIHNSGDLGDPAQVRLIQGAASAIASLCGLGYKVIVVTNQGGVARGKYTEADVQAVHQHISDLITQASSGARIECFYYCPFHPQGSVAEYTQEHNTRKPAPGMLIQGAEDFKLDLEQSWMIGDQMRDIQAGAAAGVRTILIHPDADQYMPQDFSQVIAKINRKTTHDDRMIAPDFLGTNLVEAVRIIAKQRKPDSIEEARKQGSPWQTKRDLGPSLPQTAGENTGQTHSESGHFRASSPAASPPVIKTSSTRPAKAQPITAPRPTADQTPQKEQISKDKQELTKAPCKDKKKTDPGRADPWQSIVGKYTSEHLLELILIELRGQRGEGKTFSYLNILAIVVQLIAATCLLVALVMGANDPYLFARWLGAGVIIQLATIAILLFARW